MSDEKDNFCRANLHETVDEFIGYAVTVRVKNKHKWMVGFSGEINKLLAAIGDEDRVKFDGEDRLYVTPSGGKF